MRLKSDIWVKAYLRRCHVAGCPAMLVRRGDEDAGAIFIQIARLDGTVALFGPAPALSLADDTERRWVNCFGQDFVAESEAACYLERQLEYDPDLWLVEVEDRSGRHFLDDWLATT